MFSHRDLIAYFDYSRPIAREIRERYRNIVDLARYSSIRDEDVLSFIVTLRANQAIVLPDWYGRRLLEVPGYNLDNYRCAPHLLHWRHAPDVRLNTTTMTLDDATRRNFSLRSAAKEAEWDFHIPHRGFGIIDVRTGEYTFWPFLYVLEGIKMEELAHNLIKRRTINGFDVTGTVPSLEKEGMFYTVTLRNVPYISSGEAHVLGTQLHCVCDCLWGRYGARRVRDRRYVGGERMMCRHGIAFYQYLNRESNNILNMLPQLTGIMNPWYNLKQRTLIGGRKLTKTQMNSILSMLIAYMGVEKCFE